MGKSTILALLQGLYLPQQGTILVDGHPINQDNAPSLRQSIATVSQSAYLFDADLHFNLTLGQEHSAEAINQALDIVGLQGFVDALPNNINTKFGSDGFTISGGEKARLCLARALLMDCPILLLDEVTAHIDSIHEAEILQNIQEKLPNKSVIVISHRLSSVQTFPRIVFLENGAVREEGTHEKLLTTLPSYKEIFGQQIAIIGSYSKLEAKQT